jgi:very-short-patch-repair endonuclease
MPNLFTLLAIILAVLVAFLLFKKYSKSGSSAAFPYQSKTSLCSLAERSFLGVLDQLLADKYRVFLKVRLADLIEIPKGVSKSSRQSALNRISGKPVDFVICDKNDLSILGVVELDGQSHKSSQRWERDSFVDRALESAGIPIVHIKAQKSYSVVDIQNQLQNNFLFMAGKSETNPRPSPSDSKEQWKIKPISDDTETIELCPDCGATLVKRQAKKGKFAGEYFLACSNFPKCRKIVPIKQGAIWKD